jgi:hypothetical protein
MGELSARVNASIRTSIRNVNTKSTRVVSIRYTHEKRIYNVFSNAEKGGKFLLSFVLTRSRIKRHYTFTMDRANTSLTVISY